MQRRFTRRTRETVLPGDVLADAEEFKVGEGAYELDGKIRAEVLGIKTINGNAVGVIPAGGRHMPETGDMVIGVINDVGPSNWMVDISAPYPAPLHVNEVPWKVEFGDTSKYLSIGNVVILKVLMVDESKKIQVTMNDSGLRRLEGGQVTQVSYSKVSRIIGKSGSMIQLLKNMTDCRIFVGQNGRIWIDGEDENAEVAVKAIKLIEENAQADNLTEKVKAFLEENIRSE